MVRSSNHATALRSVQAKQQQQEHCDRENSTCCGDDATISVQICQNENSCSTTTRHSNLKDKEDYDEEGKLTDSQLLFTDEKKLRMALRILHFSVLCETINSLILSTNYTIMCDLKDEQEKQHPDTFESISPFKFSSATYFLMLMRYIGSAISSALGGSLSDRFGRRPVILFCLFSASTTSVVNYFLRHSFMVFSVGHFFTGLFSCVSAVALAYIGDVHSDQEKRDSEITTCMAMYTFGTTLGCLIGAIMSPEKLFTPLFVGAFLTCVAGILCAKFLLEPDKELVQRIISPSKEGPQADSQYQSAAATSTGSPKGNLDIPVELDQRTLWNIILGATVDSFGSSSLVPMAFSPLMFRAYYADFLEKDMPPVMSEQVYKILYALICIPVIPIFIITPKLFAKYGPARCCVVTNILTGAVTIALFYITWIEPTTKGSFALFMIVLYGGFPFTIISQMTTSPMLDRISPLDQRGYVQGLSMSALNIGSAVAPFIFGLLYDIQGELVCYWTATAVSLGAAIINFPLIFNSRLSSQTLKKSKTGNDEALVDEAHVIQKLDLGQYVPSDILFRVNMQRIDRGDPILFTSYGNYKDDEGFLEIEHENMLNEYTIIRSLASKQLHNLKHHPDMRDAAAASINALWDNEEETLRTKHEMGEWFTDYMVNNGYHPGEAATLMKHMIMTSFPPLTKGGGKVSPENIEGRLLRIVKLCNHFMDMEESLGDTYSVNSFQTLVVYGGTRYSMYKKNK